MLPTRWMDFVFPTILRNRQDWIDQFGKTRRTYLFGFGPAANALGRHQVEDIKARMSAAFLEDPRRVIPLEGWRELFKHKGETFLENEFYTSPPPGEKKRDKCSRWGAYGKDQPEHAWLRRPMRLYDALKSIAALYEAKALNEAGDPTAERVNLIPSPKTSGSVDPAGELALHIAIFNLSRFNIAYFENHLSDVPTLEKLYEHCGLWHHFNGADVPTFLEIAQGLSATYRTCALMKEFAQREGLPELGEILPDMSSRGTNRTHRAEVKEATRKGILAAYSADCVVEIFVH